VSRDGSLKFKIKVNAPLVDVWNAWTDTDTIIEWFSPEANIEPRLEGAYELFFDTENHYRMSTIGCTIIEFKPREHLSFSWKGPDQYAGLMNERDVMTHVRVKFWEENGATHVYVEHLGWGEGVGWAEARAWHKRAWDGVLSNLKSFFRAREHLYTRD